MKRVSLLLVGLLLVSVGAFAGDVITNDTGEDMSGLRVVFSQPVLITAFGESLISVEPQMLSYEFVFSGGTVEPWGTQWFNFAPTTASIVETEWLAKAPLSISDSVYVPTNYVDEVTFSIELLSNLGVPLEAVITRRKSVETIPFWVDYAVDNPADAAEYRWALYTPDYRAQYESGRSVHLLPKSNAKDLTLSLRIVIDDISYRWEETLDFPLHNLTEISLDATAFFPNEDVGTVVWSAANGDPADAVTFPIADATEATTTLISDWPNVLTVSCAMTSDDASVRAHDAEALIYFRDGTPFENRSVASTIHNPITSKELDKTLDAEFSLLRSLGVNTITTGITWYFGEPDEEGNWTIQPLWKANWPLDPRGYTVLLEDFEKIVTRAHEAGFRVEVEMRSVPYNNNKNIEWDRSTWRSPVSASSTFRTTEEFWEGNGEGMNNMFLFYLDKFILLGVDFVYLGVENPLMEFTDVVNVRSFYDSIIQEYRSRGFTGGISYASSFTGDVSPGKHLVYLEEYGIPYLSMDAVASTYYPELADREGASTLDMQQWMREDIEIYFKPRSAIYNLPTIIEDCYCFGYKTCAMNPVEHAGERDTENPRRYFNAILREFAAENINSETPWILTMTIGEYKIMDDSNMKNFFQDGIVAYPWLNESARNTHLQYAIKVFFSDKPLIPAAETDGATAITELTTLP